MKKEDRRFIFMDKLRDYHTNRDEHFILLSDALILGNKVHKSSSEKKYTLPLNLLWVIAVDSSSSSNSASTRNFNPKKQESASPGTLSRKKYKSQVFDKTMLASSARYEIVSPEQTFTLVAGQESSKKFFRMIRTQIKEVVGKKDETFRSNLTYTYKDGATYQGCMSSCFHWN